MDLRLEQIQLRLQGAHWIVGYQKQDPKRPTFFFSGPEFWCERSQQIQQSEVNNFICIPSFDYHMM